MATFLLDLNFVNYMMVFKCNWLVIFEVVR